VIFSPSNNHVRSCAHSLMRFGEALARTPRVKIMGFALSRAPPHTPQGRAFERRPASVVRACTNERAKTSDSEMQTQKNKLHFLFP